MKEKCIYCNKELELKAGSKSMHGHIIRCNEFKKWKNSVFTYEYLYDEYINKNKSAIKIANENGWTSSTIINKQLRQLNIPVRNISESHYTEVYKTKIESTNLKIYGAINPLCKGTKSFQKRNRTVKKKYGVKNVFQYKDVKDKIRESGAFKSLFPNYNVNAIPLIEEYGKRHGYKFQHAENGGEYYVEGLGYYLDGYDRDKNVAIEIDEWHHFNKDGTLKKKDIVRQKRIEKKLNCTFIRIKYEN